MACARALALSASTRADCPPRAAAGSGPARNARRSGSRTRAPRTADRRAATGASCATIPPPPPGQVSVSSEACAQYGCGHARCHACAISTPSARRCRSAPQPSRLAPCSPGSPPGSSASSSPACAEKSAYLPPIPNLAQDRSCHEKRRAARVYVIVREGTSTQTRPEREVFPTLKNYSEDFRKTSATHFEVDTLSLRNSRSLSGQIVRAGIFFPQLTQKPCE